MRLRMFRVGYVAISATMLSMFLIAFILGRRTRSIKSNHVLPLSLSHRTLANQSDCHAGSRTLETKEKPKQDLKRAVTDQSSRQVCC